MSVVTISRELGAFGEEIATELARISGFRLLDREYLEKKLGDYGIGPEQRQKFDERRPGFWASLSQARDDYLHFLKSAVYEEAGAGDCIVIGRGAVALFQAVPSMISLRLVCPFTLRVDRVREYYRCNERHAQQIVEQSDHDRSGFHKYFFSMDWADPRGYDLVINTSRMDIAQAARLADHCRREMIGADKEEAGRLRIAELLLGQKVVTQIVYSKKIPVHFLEAAASGNRVVLRGVANTQAAIDAALEAAKTVPGVSEAESAIQVIQEFTVMP